MKTKHLTVRLDDETAAIVEKYQAQFGTQTSETISRLIRAADGEKFVTVVTTSIAHTEELSFFAGRVEKLKMVWRELKSRLAAPRPIDPNDTDAINQWRAEREKIAKFYDDCTTLWNACHSICGKLTGLSTADLEKIQKVLASLSSWSSEYEKNAKLTKTQDEKNSYLSAKKDFDVVIDFLKQLGIEKKELK